MAFQNFIQYLTEAADKNTHMFHIEEAILLSGFSGGEHAIEVLNNYGAILSGNASNSMVTTQKWDGGMAIFAGTDPKTKKFFVGTKAVFSKQVPKLVFTPRDADNYYSDKPAVAEILKIALSVLPALGIKKILQGDVLFTQSMIRASMIDGEKCIVFRPNTITYGVPADSDLARQMLRAKIGIVWHTEYSGGSTVFDTKASFNIDVSYLRQNPNVWFTDAYLDDFAGVVKFSKSESARFNRYVAAAEKDLYAAGAAADTLSNSVAAPLVMTFANKKIREGKLLVSSDVDELIAFLSSKYKSAAGQTKVLEVFTKDRKRALSIFDFMYQVTQAKNMILNKLNQIQTIGSFKETENGYDVIDQEGYVALTDAGVVKLVDRLSFSRLNFAGQERFKK
jgi:Family of unknown function (DUF6267)